MSAFLGTLFLNARSGAADQKRADELRQSAEERQLEVIAVTPGLDVAALVRDRLTAGMELFIAAGGDGTIHHVYQALVGSEARLGIVPFGTVNHLARDLGLPLDWREALDVVFDGEAKAIDVGKVNGVFFTNILLLGVYADMVRERERLRHWYGKTRAYLRAIAMSIKRFHEVTLAVETNERAEVVKTSVFAVSVNRYDFDSAGLVAPKVSFNEGLLSVYWLPTGGRAATVKVIAKFLAGMVVPGRDLKSLQTKEVKISGHHSHMRMGMNGELVNLHAPLVVSILPSSLKVVIPRATNPPE